MLRPSRFSRKSGLTLIEVMVALGVLIILVGGIFMVVQTSLKTVLLIDERASREDEVTNLTDILRSNFRNLPRQSILTAEAMTEGNVRQFLFTVRNAPGFLTWLSAPEADNMVVLLTLRQDSVDDTWRVCLKRFVPPTNLPEEELTSKRALKLAADIPWLELVANFERVGVRFFDGATQEWKDAWTNKKKRPSLIEITLIYEHVKDDRSATAVFWIPPVQGGAA